MKKTKMQKGITLVALIITIVVLLILAVVSIGAVRNSAIIGHATNTSDTWKQAQENETLLLDDYLLKIKKFIKKEKECFVSNIEGTQGLMVIDYENMTGEAYYLENGKYVHSDTIQYSSISQSESAFNIYLDGVKKDIGTNAIKLVLGSSHISYIKDNVYFFNVVENCSRNLEDCPKLDPDFDFKKLDE